MINSRKSKNTNTNTKTIKINEPTKVHKINLISPINPNILNSKKRIMKIKINPKRKLSMWRRNNSSRRRKTPQKPQNQRSNKLLNQR